VNEMTLGQLFMERVKLDCYIFILVWPYLLGVLALAIVALVYFGLRKR
jgi:hypothetical protein